MTNSPRRNIVRSSVHLDDSGLDDLLEHTRSRKNKIVEYETIAEEQEALARQEFQAMAEKFRTTNIVGFITSRCREKSIELRGKFKIDDDCDLIFPNAYWADIPTGEAAVDQVIGTLESLGIPKDHVKKVLVTSKDGTSQKNRPAYNLYIALDDVVVEGMIAAATKDRFAPIEGKLRLNTPPTPDDLQAAQKMIEDETGHEVIGLSLPEDSTGKKASFKEEHLKRIRDDVRHKVISDMLGAGPEQALNR